MSAQPESVPRCLDPKIDIRVAALGRLWSAPEAVQRVTTRFSNRLVHCLGRANATRGTISLAPALQSDPALLDQALTHELAHIVAFRLVGKTEPAHGPTWQRLMRQAGYEPSIRLAAPTIAPAPTRASPARRFRHTCTTCHFNRTAARRMPAWRCADCVAAGLDGVLNIEPFEACR